MNNWIKYPKMKRLENTTITEKIDGSNFSWRLENDKLMFFSRNKEVNLKNKNDKFYHEFIKFIDDIHKKIPFEKDFIYYAEVLGQTDIKYFDDYKKVPTKNKLYLIDIAIYVGDLGNDDWKYIFMKFDDIEEISKIYNLNLVPITTFNDLNSKINPNVLREGLVLRYEHFNEQNKIDFQWKLKLVEIKNRQGKTYPQNIKCITFDKENNEK